MKSKIYSFSATKDEEKSLVEELKKQYDKQGISFSWVVLRALEQYKVTNTKGSSNG